MQKFSSGNDLSVFDSGKNNVVVSIHPTIESPYTPEYRIKDEDLVDNMGDDMLEATKQENGNICYDYDFRFG